jgi:hypothetical protein
LVPDGVIDVDDVFACLDCLSGVAPPHPGGLAACDVNCHGGITQCDCDALLRQMAGGSPLVRSVDYGDVVARFGIVDIADLLCILDEFAGAPCAGSGDISPCGGDGVVDVGDILAVLTAFAGPYC